MTTVVNQYGKYVYGEARDHIVSEYDKDRTKTVYDGRRIRLVGHSTDSDGNRIIKVEI